MPLPKSLTQPLRQAQLVAGSGWRAYFAPFNQQAAVSQGSSIIGPTIYDLLVTGRFIDTAALKPAGWFDLGYVKNFKFTPGSKTGNVMTGYRGAIRAKYRAEAAEKFGITFAEVSRTTVRIATGCQVFNLLKTTATASTTGPLSSTGTAAVAIGASGYVASGAVAGYIGQPTLYVPTGSGASFPVGSYIVADKDYDNTSFGSIGDSGANVYQGAVTDVDFIRKTSDYVQGVQAVVGGVGGGDALILNGPFVGGGNAPFGTTPTTAPTAGAKVQGITGWAAREGGTYLAEWSAIFLLDTLDQSQILFYYPRVAPDAMVGMPGVNLQNATAIQTYDMETTFDSLAFDDPLDGETVMRYFAYYPRPGLSAGI